MHYASAVDFYYPHTWKNIKNNTVALLISSLIATRANAQGQQSVKPGDLVQSR